MHSPKPPTKPMLAAIGRVATESARVEGQVLDLFGHLIDSPYGRVIAAGDGLTQVINQCLRAARYNCDITEEQTTRLVSIFDSINTLRPMRNFVVHACWERTETTGLSLGVLTSRPSPNADGKGTEGCQVWSVVETNLLADSFKAVGTLIEAYIDSTFDRFKHRPLIRKNEWAAQVDALTKLGELLTPPGGWPNRSSASTL